MTASTSDFSKYFALICLAFILLFVFAVLKPTEEPIYITISVPEVTEKPFSEIPLGPAPPPAQPNLAHEDVKYILQWTPSAQSPFDKLGRRRSAFIDNHCSFNNCFVTDDRNYFLDMKDFDAVVFHGKDLNPKDLPKVRSKSQKYIFAMMESSHYYPTCGAQWNGFFNWTWTYRLDSDVRWGYVTIFDESGVSLGPKVDMDWPVQSQLDDLPVEDLEKIKRKTKAAAWFVSNCHSKSKREEFVKQLMAELKLYDMTLDVYGQCGPHKCPRSSEDLCNKMLKDDYFFYLSFENSFAEDYVTEKLFTALDNLVVPVVYGGANYSRFLPPDSYLNARELGPKGTAERMRALLSRPEDYRAMLSRRSRLRYRLTWDNDDLCALCNLLNNQKRLETVSVLRNFTGWWSPPGACVGKK